MKTTSSVPHSSTFATTLIGFALFLFGSVGSVNTASAQCRNPDGSIRQSFVNIAIVMDQLWLDQFGGNVAAARAEARAQTMSAVNPLNLLFWGTQVEFQVFFQPDGIFPKVQGNGPADFTGDARLKFVNLFPCIAGGTDCLLLFTNIGSGIDLGYGPNEVGVVSNRYGNTPVTIAHEIGHAISMTHASISACMQDPGFMCSTGEGAIQFTQGDGADTGQNGIFNPQTGKCDSWKGLMPVLSSDYTCPIDPKVSIVPDNKHPIVGCGANRTTQTYSITIVGTAVTNYFSLAARYPKKDLNIDIATQGIDFNTLSGVPGSSLFNALSIREIPGNTNSAHEIFTLLPNELRVFQFQLTYNPDPSNPSNSLIAYVDFYFGTSLNSLNDNLTSNFVSYPFLNMGNTTTNVFQANRPIVVDNLTLGPNIIEVTPPEILVRQGGSITISGNANAKFVYNTHVAGCNGMWKGITVNALGTLEMKGNMIEDAQYAVNAKRRSTVSVTNNVFNNNNIGVFIESKGTSNYSVNAIIDGNLFNSTKSSLNDGAYGGQSPMPNGRAFCGIVANDIIADFSGNNFWSLKNGIVAKNADLGITGSSFLNLYDEPPGTGYPGGSQARGTAILADNVVLQANGNTVNMAKNGIYQTGGAIEAIGNTMGMMKNGIRSRPSANTTLNIRTNNIKAKDWGIQASQQAASKIGCTLQSNTIEMDGNPAGIGISFSGLLGASDVGLRVIANPTTLHEAQMGIQISNIAVGDIRNNILTLRAPETNLFGLKIENSDRMLVLGNYASGAGAVPGSKTRGIHLLSSTRSVAECNTALNTDVGGSFEGACTGKNKLDVRGNTVSGNRVGLQMEANGIIGEQLNRGNIWDGSFTQNGALHLGGGLAQQSRFIVDASEDPRFLPSNPQPFGWFNNIQDPSLSFYCPHLTSPEEFDISPVGMHNSTEDIKTARGEMPGATVSPVLTWTTQRRLVERLNDEGNPYPNDPDIIGFLEDAQGSGLRGYADVQSGFRQAFNMSAYQLEQLQNLEDYIFAELSDLRFLNAQLSSPELTVQDSLDLVLQKEAAITAIEQASSSRQAILGAALPGRATMLGALFSVNSNLPALDVWETNEKTVNEIYILTVGVDNHEFTSNQRQALYDIAIQCPVEGGDAVLRARALLDWTLDTPVIYEDGSNCVESGLRGSNQTISRDLAANRILLFPNPAPGQLNIEYRFDKFEDLPFQLFDQQGKLVLQQLLPNSRGRVSIETKSLKPGIYWYLLPGAPKSVASGKVTVISE